MLVELAIRNFAIIEDLTIRLGAGLTILSGETGAGKSIIINAFNLLLGARASASLVRTGAQSAEVEALFEIRSDSDVALAMREQGYDPAEGLLVRRIVSSSDRHRIYINGRLATMQVLSGLTASLASIAGQHAHQGLLREESHLALLDQFGGLRPLREDCAAVFRGLVPLIDQERALVERQAQLDEQLELLRFQAEEIELADLQEAEDETLDAEWRRLKNGATLFELVQGCAEGLYSGEGAVAETLLEINKALDRAAAIDKRLADSAEEVKSLGYRAEDLAADLNTYLKSIDPDPRRLDAVEARLDLVNKLKRKYGGSLDAVLAKGREARRQMEEIENLGETLVGMRADLEQRHGRLCALARQLSVQRQEAATRLSRLAEDQLAELKMAGTRFETVLQPVRADEDTSPYLTCGDCRITDLGIDRAAFMIAPNVGEAIKSLAAIASGGELSRVVLALKAVLAGGDAMETLVFDEVDAGIGGAVADVVGKKLFDLAQRHQVLCITHLAQIARYGEHHFQIQKKVAGGRTYTDITPLNAEQRIEEIARMIGGEQITETTLAHAQEMLAAKPPVT